MVSAQEALERLKDGNRRFVLDIADNDQINRKDGFKVIKELMHEETNRPLLRMKYTGSDD